MTLNNWKPADFPEEQEKGLPKWRKSYARDLLLGDLEAGVIPRAHHPEVMDTREIFLTRPEYKPYGFKNFYTNLQSLREQLQNNDSQAERDSKAFEAFKKNHPPKPLCERGYPHWEGSQAQKQLKMDIKNGEHMKIDKQTNKKVTPMKLWSDENKPEYREFPEKVFRGHTHQEVRTQKYHNHLKKKEEDKKAKRMEKHEKAMVRIDAKKQKAKEQQHLDGLIKHSSFRKNLHQEDLKVELLHRGVEEGDYVELGTFTNRKKMLKQLEEDSLAHEAEWIKKAATKGFKKLSAAGFNIPEAPTKCTETSSP